jgi:SH3-like domain-containing protein
MKVFDAHMSKPMVVVAVCFGLTLFFAGVAHAERMAVSVNKANIRSGPGKTFDVLWEVEKYHPLQIIDKKGKWYRFRDFEGDEAWIYSALLKNIKTVITKKKKCNVRADAGTKFKVLFTAEKGIPFKVLNEKGDWIHIQHADGDKGWIHKSLVW